MPCRLNCFKWIWMVREPPSSNYLTLRNIRSHLQFWIYFVQNSVRVIFNIVHITIREVNVVYLILHLELWAQSPIFIWRFFIHNSVKNIILIREKYNVVVPAQIYNICWHIMRFLTNGKLLITFLTVPFKHEKMRYRIVCNICLHLQQIN